jgi:hypothetical protein
MTRLHRAWTRSIHASCWSAGEESEALWRLYARDDGKSGVGVALRTTLGKLEASVAAEVVYVSPMTYRHYHEGPAFNDELDAFMHKRLGFSAEREVRLLKVNKQQFEGLVFQPSATAELPPHVFMKWPARSTVEEIVLSPYADQAYEDRSRAAIATIDAAPCDRVCLSILNPRRYAPGF